MAKIYDHFYGEIDTNFIVLVGGKMDGRVVEPTELILGEEKFVPIPYGLIGRYVFEGDRDKFGRRVMKLKEVTGV